MGRILAGKGVAILDADQVAHEVMAPGGPAYEDVRNYFGETILNADGTIDRKILGPRVFASAEDREALNRLVHPHVRQVWRSWLNVTEDGGKPARGVIIPLLYEVGVEKDFDCVLCVASSEQVMWQRLQERGLSHEECRQRLAAQWPVAEKMKWADYVIVNEGTISELTRQTESVWQTILEKEK